MDNKDEVLEVAREQKHKNADREKNVMQNGASIALVVTVIVTALMVGIEFRLFHKWDYGKPTIVALICSISDLYEGIKLKNIKRLIFGIVAAFIFVMCLIMYVTELF